MTNAQIILQNSVFLMEQGVLKATDELILVADEDGKVREVNRPEEIHTFQAWRALGYQVQKGQHAVAKFPVWKYRNASKKGADDREVGEHEELEKKEKGRCFMKTAFFFTADQVKPIEKKEVK